MKMVLPAVFPYTIQNIQQGLTKARKFLIPQNMCWYCVYGVQHVHGYCCCIMRPSSDSTDIQGPPFNATFFGIAHGTSLHTHIPEPVLPLRALLNQTRVHGTSIEHAPNLYNRQEFSEEVASNMMVEMLLLRHHGLLRTTMLWVTMLKEVTTTERTKVKTKIVGIVAT